MRRNQPMVMPMVTPTETQMVSAVARLRRAKWTSSLDSKVTHQVVITAAASRFATATATFAITVATAWVAANHASKVNRQLTHGVG